MKLHLLIVAVKRKLMQLCGVERMVKDAFIEGHTMALDNDYARLERETYSYKFNGKNTFTFDNEGKFNQILMHSRCWRSVDEAWVNSDAQEMFE